MSRSYKARQPEVSVETRRWIEVPRAVLYIKPTLADTRVMARELPRLPVFICHVIDWLGTATHSKTVPRLGPEPLQCLWLPPCTWVHAIMVEMSCVEIAGCALPMCEKMFKYPVLVLRMELVKLLVLSTAYVPYRTWKHVLSITYRDF